MKEISPTGQDFSNNQLVGPYFLQGANRHILSQSLQISDPSLYVHGVETHDRWRKETAGEGQTYPQLLPISNAKKLAEGCTACNPGSARHKKRASHSTRRRVVRFATAPRAAAAENSREAASRATERATSSATTDRPSPKLHKSHSYPMGSPSPSRLRRTSSSQPPTPSWLTLTVPLDIKRLAPPPWLPWLGWDTLGSIQ